MKWLCTIWIVISAFALNAQTLEELFKEHQPGELSILAEAQDLAHQGQFKKAVKLLYRAVRNDPEYFNGFILLGYLHYDKQMYKQAAVFFNNAVRIDSKNTGVLFMRGNCFLYEERYRSAANDYLECIKLDPAYTPAYNNLAVLRLKYQDIAPTSVRDLEIAKTDLEKIFLEQEDPDPRMLFNLGMVQLHLSEFDAAITLMDKVLEKDPAFAKAWFFRGLSQYYLRNYYSAKADMDKALALNYQPEKSVEFVKHLGKIVNYISLHRPGLMKGMQHN